MATFTKGTAYKFIGNNLPENQCVTYSMFEVYNVPITAYNITVNVYLRHSVNLLLQDISPSSNFRSPSDMSDDMQLIPYHVGSNLSYEELNDRYYDTLTNNILGIRKLYNSKTSNEYWVNWSEGDEEIEKFSDNGVVSLNGLKNRYWYTGYGDGCYKTEIANLGTNNYLIWNITATNVNTPTLPIFREFYLLIQGMGENLETAAVYWYNSEGWGENTDENLPFTLEFDDLETIPNISLRNGGEVSFNIQKEVISNSSNNGVKTLSINYYISDICFSGNYISE